MPAEREESPSRPRSERETASKIGFLLLDKVVFGLLIVLAGFMLNSILDHNRAHTAFQNEIAKVRVEKAAEVWGALDRQQLLAEEMPSLSHRLTCTRTRYEYARIRSELAGRNVEFRRLLATNRFWLGDELFGQLRAYALGQTNLVAILGQKMQLIDTVLANLNKRQNAELLRVASKLKSSPTSHERLSGVTNPLTAGSIPQTPPSAGGCVSLPGKDSAVSRALNDLTKKRQDVVAVMNGFVG